MPRMEPNYSQSSDGGKHQETDTGKEGDTKEPDEAWFVPEPEDPIAILAEEIDRLALLDPAEAAAPGAALADVLSRALEEEER
jgi:hypothetical protein